MVLNNSIFNKGTLKNHKMTYIIAGNFNNTNFLMSDCIASSKDSPETFDEKTYQLNSNTTTTYTTLSGDRAIMASLLLFDEWMDYENKIVDYENIETIEQIIISLLESPFIEKNTAFTFEQKSRLFFLTKDKLFYYDIFFKDNSLEKIEINHLKDNHYVLCDRIQDKIIDNENMKDLYNFSKEKIIQYNIGSNADNSLNKLFEFKNRFSFVESDDMKLIRPFKNVNEYIKFVLYSYDWDKI